MGSKSEAIYPSIAMPAYNLEKSFDPFNSIVREARTPAQKIGVWAWKMILTAGQLKNLFRPKIYSKGDIWPKHKGTTVMLLMVYTITNDLSIMSMSTPLQKEKKNETSLGPC